MLYQLYETHRALLSPFSEFASASSKLYNHPLSPFAHAPMSQRVSAGFDLLHRLAKEYEKPEFGITTVKVGNGIEVADGPRAARGPDLRVLARDVGVVEHDVGLPRAAQTLTKLTVGALPMPFSGFHARATPARCGRAT